MGENENHSIPLVYHHKILAAVQLFCTIAVFVAVAAQGWFMIELAKQGEVETLHLVSIIAGAFLCLTMGLNIPKSWRVLGGFPVVWIENDDLVLRLAGTRRIPLDQITQVEFDRFASGYDPAKVTLHLRQGKPVTIWLHTLRLVSGFADILRGATAKAV